MFVKIIYLVKAPENEIVFLLENQIVIIFLRMCENLLKNKKVFTIFIFQFHKINIF